MGVHSLWMFYGRLNKSVETLHGQNKSYIYILNSRNARIIFKLDFLKRHFWLIRPTVRPAYNLNDKIKPWNFQSEFVTVSIVICIEIYIDHFTNICFVMHICNTSLKKKLFCTSGLLCTRIFNSKKIESMHISIQLIYENFY